MTKRKYPDIRDGEWIHPLKGYRMACCDCGLVHHIDFRIVQHKGRNRIVFAGTRDRRATAAMRRSKRFAKVKAALD